MGGLGKWYDSGRVHRASRLDDMSISRRDGHDKTMDQNRHAKIASRR